MASGNNIKEAGLKEMNDKLFMQALNEVLAEKPTLLKTEQTQQILQAYFTLSSRLRPRHRNKRGHG